jgi:hypothetical protein
MERLTVDLTDRSLHCALDDRTAWAAFARLLDAAAELRGMYGAAGESEGFPGVHAAMTSDDAPLTGLVESDDHVDALAAVVDALFATLRAAESWSREWEP